MYILPRGASPGRLAGLIPEGGCLPMKLCRIRFFRLFFLILPLLLSSCHPKVSSPERLCRLVLEEGEGFSAESYTASAAPGGEISFFLKEEEGYTIIGSDYEPSTLLRTGEGVTLTLKDVRYTETVRLTVERSELVLCYDPCTGRKEDRVSLPVTPSHLRINTAGEELFSREGATLCAWNAEEDGSGRECCLGGRILPEEAPVLYAVWENWSPAEDFLVEEGKILRYLGSSDPVVVPAEIDGETVRTIGEGAFSGCSAKKVILPSTIRTIEDGAFTGASLSDLYLFDSVRFLSDYSFQDCSSLKTLHLNAAEPPVYSGSYYATFADKFDRLSSLAEEPKIVLFSGSSARFGYDSQKIDEAFPEYEVGNMGVFAYTNALPQLELIRTCMAPGDILLLSPEFDAAKRQFCTTHSLDAPFFNLMEADYNLISLLDLREYDLVFTSLREYLSSREGLPGKSYALSPSDFDEEGLPVSTPSYNEYGDYILYRPNAPEDTPVYGLPVPYTRDYYLEDLYLVPFNRELSRFQEDDVTVLLTFSPRNRLAVSQESTPEAVRDLEAYLREKLIVPVISHLEDSLVSGRYLYGTDNHLSTEGVQIRTEAIIRDLKAYLE